MFSNGLLPSAESRALNSKNKKRLIQRYQFGAWTPTPLKALSLGAIDVRKQKGLQSEDYMQIFFLFDLSLANSQKQAFPCDKKLL